MRGSDQMKIEKISENQIRCTLTREDLEERHIKLSELAYGTDKAKDLFHEMMGFASAKYGFDAEDIPLMIEAVPINSDTIILIITKVENPEELDTRYADFSEDDDSYDDQDDEFDDNDSEYDECPAFNAPRRRNNIGLFLFQNMDYLFQAASAISYIYNASNSLYKKDGMYYLILHQGNTPKDDFNRVCGILSEYGTEEPVYSAHDSYFNERGKILISDNALQMLAKI